MWDLEFGFRGCGFWGSRFRKMPRDLEILACRGFGVEGIGVLIGGLVVKKLRC